MSPKAILLALLIPMSSGAFAAEEETPWERMINATNEVVDGAVVVGADVVGVTADTVQQLHTFMPYRARQRKAAKIEIGSKLTVGCTGVNFSGVFDGQLEQYQQSIEAAIDNAPNMAIYYLAYSQPVLKSIIDRLNQTMEFGVNLMDNICNAVRAAADAAHEDNEKMLAEADCSTQTGFKSINCMTAQGLDKYVVKNLDKAQKWLDDKATALMDAVPGGASKYGTTFYKRTGGNNSYSATSKSQAEKDKEAKEGKKPGDGKGKNTDGTCEPEPEGSLGVLMGLSGMNCDEVNRYYKLLPQIDYVDGQLRVIGAKLPLTTLAANLTTELYQLHLDVYNDSAEDYSSSEAHIELMNRTGFTISPQEHIEMREMSQREPARFIVRLQNLSTVAMLKELDGAISSTRNGIRSALTLMAEPGRMPKEISDAYIQALEVLNDEMAAIEKQAEHDIRRNRVMIRTAP